MDNVVFPPHTTLARPVSVPGLQFVLLAGPTLFNPL